MVIQVSRTSGDCYRRQIHFLVANLQYQGNDCNYSAFSALRSTTFSGFCVSILLMLEKTSANSIVPAKTSAVPIQWTALKGLLKYAMEMSRERNLRSVTTNVTDSDVHSQVSMNTDLMQTYLAQSQVLWNNRKRQQHYGTPQCNVCWHLYVRRHSGKVRVLVRKHM